KRLAEALGGTLDVASEINQGTQLILTLKLDPAHQTTLLAPEDALSRATGVRPDEFTTCDLRGVRVLVADDGETNRDLITLLLEDSGAEVRVACNGKEAVDRLTQQPDLVDVVLMDMQMPVMDGYTATGELRSRGFQQPIIALTANAMVGDEAKCREAGCSDYLTKPLDLDALLRLVRRSAGQPIAETGAPGETTQDHPSSDPQGRAEAEPVQLESPESAEAILPNDWLRQFACELIDRVSGELPAMIEACQMGDLDEVARQAHWIKGSGGTVGLDQLTELAEGCEDAIKDAQAEQVLSAIEKIQSFVDVAGRERSDTSPC
ncbi:MAG: response regulator, partial [Pirellulales bacterium]|nr:response regulator [Pirellulales bacterium]